MLGRRRAHGKLVGVSSWASSQRGWFRRPNIAPAGEEYVKQWGCAGQVRSMSKTRAERRDRFERIFADHYEAVLAYALRRASREVAEDVAAETFMVVWRRLEDVPREARPWLFGVARRVLSGQRRGERRRASLHARLATQPAPAPAAATAAGLLPALARLQERDRELLLLVAWDGLAPVEAAQALGLSRIAVRVRLHRVRRRLAAELEADNAHHATASPAVDLRIEEA